MTDAHETTPASVWRNPIHFLAFGFGSGAIRPAPGTWGTLAALPFVLVWQHLPVAGYGLVIVPIELADSEAPVPPAPELTQSGAFDALLVLPLVALGQRLHGLDQDAVRTVATVVDVAQGLEHGADLRAGLAAWALSTQAFRDRR